MSFFKQLGRSFQRSKFGRQLIGGGSKFGHQLTRGVKLLPQSFKDTSKVYSDLERKTHGIPIVHDVFGFGAKATSGVGNLLSGNVGKAIQDGRGALSQGKDVLGATAKFL